MRLIDLDELLKREEQAYRQVITQESKTPDAPIVMTLIHEAFVGMLTDSPIVEAEPVVRCKDCEYCPDIGTKTKGMVWCRKFRTEVHPNGFCSYGERKPPEDKP
ncbi:MAG: hypothetical protein E7504_04170 [Ruminococcus sp.]|nr:hypothetical protein [Ruminococcus sp.]